MIIELCEMTIVSITYWTTRIAANGLLVYGEGVGLVHRQYVCQLSPLDSILGRKRRLIGRVIGGQQDGIGARDRVDTKPTAPTTPLLGA